MNYNITFHASYDALMKLMDEQYGGESDRERARKSHEENTEYVQALHLYKIALTNSAGEVSELLEHLENEMDYELSDSLATLLHCIHRRARELGKDDQEVIGQLVTMAYDKIYGRKTDKNYLREESFT